MIIYGDITKLDDIEAIVNASNGIGYMGGRVCVKELHKGVAEKLNLRSVAVPLLGTGTGKLNRKTVKELLINNLVSSKVIFYIVLPY